MKSHTSRILEVSEFGAVDGWTWVADITRKSDGSYSASLVQLADHQENTEDSFPPMHIDSFSDGAQLFDFLDAGWHEAHEKNLSHEDWIEIVAKTAEISPKLASEVMDALRKSIED